MIQSGTRNAYNNVKDLNESFTAIRVHFLCCVIIPSTKLNTNALVKLRGCEGWSVPLSLTCNKKSFSCATRPKYHPVLHG